MGRVTNVSIRGDLRNHPWFDIHRRAFFGDLFSFLSRLGSVWIVSTVVLYCALFLPLCSIVGSGIAAMSAIPVMAIAWFLGLRAGTIAGLLAFSANTLLLNLAGETGWGAVLRVGAGPGTCVVFFLGAGLGYLRDLRFRLRRQMEEHNCFFSLSPDILCVATSEGYLQRINRAFERTLGFSTQEVLSKPFVDFVHPDDRERTTHALQQLSAGHDAVDFENRCRCKDGSYRSIFWRSAASVEDGQIFAVAHDMTEHKRVTEAIQRRKVAEAELRKARDELEARVQRRTAELQETIARLKEEMAQRKSTEIQLVSRRSSPRRPIPRY